MNKVFTPEGWEDYVYWETGDRKTLKRIDKLIDDIDRNGNEGIGKPEPLAMGYSGWWSRRIDEKNRLVYRIVGENVQIAACGFCCGDE